jgi:hypothetical protein
MRGLPGGSGLTGGLPGHRVEGRRPVQVISDQCHAGRRRMGQVHSACPRQRGGPGGNTIRGRRGSSGRRRQVLGRKRGGPRISRKDPWHVAYLHSAARCRPRQGFGLASPVYLADRWAQSGSDAGALTGYRADSPIRLLVSTLRRIRRHPRRARHRPPSGLVPPGTKVAAGTGHGYLAAAVIRLARPVHRLWLPGPRRRRTPAPLKRRWVTRSGVRSDYPPRGP